MPEIIAVTRDDVRLTFSCPASATVLDAAEEAGYYLPSVCRHGRCGTCWAKVVAGSFELAPYITTALPPSPGSVLLCRCRPREALVIELPYRDAQVGRRALAVRRAAITALTQEAQGWTGVSLLVQRDAALGLAVEFTPGQAMELRIPGSTEWRSLAMANLANEEGRLEFLCRAEPGSGFAAWLAGARRGAEADLRGPVGKFALDETSPRPRLFIGAAEGLAPLLAMLRQLAAQRDRTRMQLIFAAGAGEMSFLEKTCAFLRPALPQLEVKFVPAAAAAAVMRAALGNGPDIYASGPLEFLAAVTAAAAAHGVAAERIRTAPTA